MDEYQDKRGYNQAHIIEQCYNNTEENQETAEAWVNHLLEEEKDEEASAKFCKGLESRIS